MPRYISGQNPNTFRRRSNFPFDILQVLILLWLKSLLVCVCPQECICGKSRLLLMELPATAQVKPFFHYSSRWGMGVGGTQIISFSSLLFCPSNLHPFPSWLSPPSSLPGRQPHPDTQGEVPGLKMFTLGSCPPLVIIIIIFNSYSQWLNSISCKYKLIIFLFWKKKVL